MFLVGIFFNEILACRLKYFWYLNRWKNLLDLLINDKAIKENRFKRILSGIFKKCKHYIQKNPKHGKAEDFEIYILYFHYFGYGVSISFKKYRNKKGVSLFGEWILPFNSVSRSFLELPVMLAKKPYYQDFSSYHEIRKCRVGLGIFTFNNSYKVFYGSQKCEANFLKHYVCM